LKQNYELKRRGVSALFLRVHLTISMNENTAIKVNHISKSFKLLKFIQGEILAYTNEENSARFMIKKNDSQEGILKMPLHLTIVKTS